MIYIKEYKIECRIISKDDIKKLINSIIDNIETDKHISITAKFKNGIQLEDNNITLFDNEFFEKEQLISVSAFIYEKNTYDNHHVVSISREGVCDYVKIKTNNKNAFSIICHDIEKTLKYMKKNNFICRIDTVPGIIISFILGFLLLPMIDIVIAYKISNNAIITYIIGCFFALLNIIIISILPRYLTLNQFDFGNASKNKPVYYSKYFWSVLLYILTQIGSLLLTKLIK